MEKYEPNPEQQIWQRVFAQSEQAARSDLRQLLLTAAEQASVYRHLTGVLTGTAAAQAKRLYEQQLETIACLKGIGILQGQGEEVLKLWNPSREPVRKLLEKCYHRARRSMAEYMSRAAEGECGVVFRTLADREGEHSAIIAGLLGRTAQEGRMHQGK